MTSVSDNLLIEILGQGNDIQSFFDSIFGFLSRCTNFYDEDVKVSEQIVMNSFKYWSLYVLNHPQASRHKYTEKLDDLDLTLDNKNDVNHEIICLTSSSSDSTSNTNFREDTVLFDTQDPMQCGEIEICTTCDDDMDNKNSTDLTNSKKCNLSTKLVTSKASDCYNGAVTEKYSWSQTITDVDIQIQLPSYVTSSRQLNVIVESTRLTVEIRSESQSYVYGELCWKCRPSESTWLLSNGVLLVHLEKSQERWWDKLLLTDDSLDVKQLDCSRPLDELPEDAQNLVHKMVWNEHQKLMGKPTTDDITRNEILKKSWNADGSPFKGTEFDPTLVKFQ